MSILHATRSHRRLTVLGAVSALVAGGVVAGNLAGAASGISALDYAQCDNVAPTPNPGDCPASAWINGILNANNSHYNEDEVTPQRLTVQFAKAGSHTITLKYLDRKGGIHAYDYLAAANATMTYAIEDRCNGIEAICADPGGTASTASVIPAYTADDTAVPQDNGPAPQSGLAIDHMANLLDPANDNPKLDLSLFGGTFATTDPIVVDNHDNACLGCGDDYATVTVSFTTASPNKVQLLFGGHLAEGFNADGWGEGLGAGSVSGGPYHIKWAAADKVSVGNRDNQIMSNAIGIIAQGSTMGSTATPSGDVAIDSADLTDVYDQANLQVASTAHPPTGNAVFSLYGPFSPDAPTAATDCADPVNGTGGNRIAGPFTVSSWSEEDATTTYDADMALLDHVNLTNTSGVTLAVGQYYQWVVNYDPNGDAYNKASISDCTASLERIHITKGTPGADSSQTITDTVTMTGGSSPTGYVSWYLFTDCSTSSDLTTAVWSDAYDPNAADPANDSNHLQSGVATSDGFNPADDAGLTTGSTTYYWMVVYAGDDNNNGGTVEECGDQQVTVQNAPTPGP